jgi:hypothetical protein
MSAKGADSDVFGSRCPLKSLRFLAQSILTKSLCDLYAFLMVKRLVYLLVSLLNWDAIGDGEGGGDARGNIHC